MRGQRGFTVMELLFVVLLMGVLSWLGVKGYFDFVKRQTEIRKSQLAKTQMDMLLSLIKEDIEHAGFGLPKVTRVTVEVCPGSSLCDTGTSRLFLSDGWAVIEDFTDNGKVDGNISDADYAVIAEATCGGGYDGFCAEVTSASTTSLVVDSTDITGRGGADISGQKAIVVLCGGQPEGGRTYSVSGNTIHLISGDTISLNTSTCTITVPAIAWYVRDNVLYRNNRRMVEGVSDFDVFLGYDNNGDGIVNSSELYSSVPSPFDPKRAYFVLVRIVKTFESPSPGSTDQTFELTAPLK